MINSEKTKSDNNSKEQQMKKTFRTKGKNSFTSSMDEINSHAVKQEKQLNAREMLMVSFIFPEFYFG